MNMHTWVPKVHMWLAEHTVSNRKTDVQETAAVSHGFLSVHYVCGSLPSVNKKCILCNYKKMQ